MVATESRVRPVCPHCETESEPGARYCALCGHNLKSDTLPVVPTPPAQRRKDLLPQGARWGIYAIVGLFAFIGLGSVIGGSRSASSPQASALGPAVGDLNATVTARVNATVAALPGPAGVPAVVAATAASAGSALQSRATPTPDAPALATQLEEAWQGHDWPVVYTVLNRLQTVAPSAVDYTDKRYVAHFFAGQELLEKGDRVGAVKEFDLANREDPGRGEAQAALVALTPTATPVPPTATPIPPPPTATPIPVPSKAQARYVDPRVLVADANQHIGENVWVQGRALSVTHHDEERGLFGTTPSQSWVQVLAQVQGKSTTESIVVRLFPRDSKVLSDECYRFYATVTGTETVTRTLTGASNEVPSLRGYAWEKTPSTRFGSCVDL